MERYSRKSVLISLMFSILLIALVTAIIVAGVLIYKGTFNAVNYSNWLFYAAMAYIAVGGFSAYGTYMNTNSYNYKYISTVMTGSYESRKKIDEELINTSFKFMIRMISVGILLFIICTAANTFF